MKQKNHSVSGVFVFLLLGIFAVFGTLLVLLGAQAYRGIILRTTEHNQNRILEAYVRHAVRGANAEGAISVEEVKGVPMLVVAEDSDEDGAGYCKWIYAYEGSLYELYSDADRDFELGTGDEICKAESFVPAINGELLTAEIRDENGTDHIIDVNVCSGR